MQAQIKLGRIRGIQIGLHYSWLIIALLMSFSLAAELHAQHPGWSGGMVWATAVSTTLLVFVSIIAHELSHAAVARMCGLPVSSITLFALGGISVSEQEPANAKTEFWIGIIGPITSGVIGLACLGLAGSLGWGVTPTLPAPLMAMLIWLGFINIILAVFNLIPGYPLDGGRVLRSLIWWATGNTLRAIQIAAGVGQFVAFCFILYGLFGFFRGAGLGGLWLAFIGWFLLNAARASRAQLVTESLRGLCVGDVMTRNCHVVYGGLDLQTFVEKYLLRTGEPCYAVVDNGRVEGMITLHEVKRVERARWSRTSVEAAMRPVSELPRVGPQSPVMEALGAMNRDEVDQLPVFSNSHMTGLISKEHILHLLQTRTELCP